MVSIYSQRGLNDIPQQWQCQWPSAVVRGDSWCHVVWYLGNAILHTFKGYQQYLSLLLRVITVWTCKRYWSHRAWGILFLGVLGFILNYKGNRTQWLGWDKIKLDSQKTCPAELKVKLNLNSQISEKLRLFLCGSLSSGEIGCKDVWLG